MKKSSFSLNLTQTESKILKPMKFNMGKSPRNAVKEPAMTKTVVPNLQLNKIRSNENTQLSTSRIRKPASSSRKENKQINLSNRTTKKRAKNPPSRTLSAHRPVKPTHDLKTLFESMKPPVAPAAVLSLLKGKLTKYEVAEIEQYSEIYYIGLGASKSGKKPEFNNGFDDENEGYRVIKNDHIAYRFEILAMLGKGSFGQVVQAYDHRNKGSVAIKILKNNEKVRKQAKIEIKILQKIRKHDAANKANIIEIYNYFCFRNHICIVMELLYIDLYQFIKANNFRRLSLPLVKRFAVQLLSTLQLTESLGIIHCDLKPENILLTSNNKSTIKVIDFGTSCCIDSKMFTYIQSRFYRAPEIILGVPYDTKIDVWSLGCILYELYTGHPLFPGKDETEQLKYIMSVIGLPPLETLESSKRAKYYFDSKFSPKIYTKKDKKLYPGARGLEELLRGVDSSFVDFLLKCFSWSSVKRYSPEKLLSHPWISAKDKKIIAVTPRNQTIGSYRHNSVSDSPNTTKHSYKSTIHF